MRLHLVVGVLVLMAVCGPTANALHAESAQGPGSAWAISPAPARTVTIRYWQLFDQTEIWVRIVPQALDKNGALPVDLIFSAIFSGRIQPHGRSIPRPARLIVQAQPSPVAALPVSHQSLAFTTGAGRRFDLAKGAAAAVSPCDECSADALVASLDPEVLKVLAASTAVTCQVLGFPCRLDPLDLNALAEFAERIGMRKSGR
jgi:hypothetical protein